jgi:simple sugar transport system ATP-binding protein
MNAPFSKIRQIVKKFKEAAAETVRFGRKEEKIARTDLEIGSTIIKMEQIVKQFPGVLANDHVDFEVRKGEIHALLGENGAGKTTLMKILYGLYQPDEGNIYVAGQKVDIRSPRDAINLGIGMVHQHFMLIPPLTVTVNIILGVKSSRGPLLDIEKGEKAIKELSEKYGLKVDPKAKIWQLSVGEQQRVEIIKALYRGAEVLILDEPTSVLTPQEVKELFSTLRSMVKEGFTIIFISHKLDEVLAVSDRITVLRDGRVISTLKSRDTNKEELAKMMVGRKVIFQLSKPPMKTGNLILKIENLQALNDKGLVALKEVSFSVYGGEILGIAGVAGNGQTELAEVLYGLRKATKGKVFINGLDMTNHSPKELIKHKVSHIPADRIGMGLLMDFTLTENLILERHSMSPFSNGLLLKQKEIDQYAEKLISDFDVRTPSKDVLAKKLSGGNLQKLLLARELSRTPQLLIAVDPTRGLDVGATEYIHLKLIEQRNKGTAILLISTDLDEVLSLSDRIAVIYEGKITGPFPIEKVSIEEIGLLMGGAAKQRTKLTRKTS